MGDPGVRRRLADAVVRHERLIRWGLAAIGLVWLALIAFGVLPYDLQPNDSHAYWVVNPADPYRGARLGGPDAFLYAPVVAQLLGPFTALPFDVFRLGFAALDLVALTLSGLLYTLVIPGVIEDIVRGNIHILLALAILAGFRFPGTWSAVLLTKVSPAIGLVWFAVRREWAALAQVALVTGLIVAVSALLGGVGLWVDWIRLLLTSSENPRTYTYLFGIAPPPLAVRMPVALLVVAWGALNERRWTVPVAAFVALPVIWPSGFALLLAVPPLWFADRRRRLEPIRRAAAAA
jgi:Glycosyltransferase family 87